MSFIASTVSAVASVRSSNELCSVKAHKNASPADTLVSSVSGMKKLVEDNDEQVEGIKKLTMGGSPDDISQVGSTSREQRKNMAKREPGLVLTWEFYNDPGYVQPEAQQSEDTLLSQADLSDTYRQGTFRMLDVKDRYPISSIQVLSKARGGRLSTSGYKKILPPYTRFMLQSVSMQSREKYQLYTTFRSFRINFFDANPEVWAFSGLLLNAENQNWSSDFRNLYHSYLRGTQCAKIGAEVYITFEDIVVSGLMINMRSDFSSSNPNSVPVQFNLIVTNELVFSSSKLTNVLMRKLYPLSAKNQPALVFELLRKNYARTYGEKERRAGVLVKTEVTMDKLDQEMQRKIYLDGKLVPQPPDTTPKPLPAKGPTSTQVA